MLFEGSLRRNNITHFPSCCELRGEKKAFIFLSYLKKIGHIRDQFKDRFADFDLLKAKMELFNNPMEVEVEPQPFYTQQQLCELQADQFLLLRKNERSDVF